MAKLLDVRKSASFISDKAKHVKINEDGITRLSHKLLMDFQTNKFSIAGWKKHTLHPKVANKSAVDWIFLADTLNFSFWCADKKSKYCVQYENVGYTGYFSLAATINRALDKDIPFTDPAYYATVSQDSLAKIFKPDDGKMIPLFEDRMRILHETGKILNDKFGGTFLNCIKSCERSCQKLLHLIITEFPSYRDEAEFHGQRVSFYKRAQILIADIWSCFEGKGLGQFNDIDTLTMFADYRIPQVLVYFDVLQYSAELQKLLDSNTELENGSAEEVEIRGMSVLAIELIKDKMRVLNAASEDKPELMINSVLIDHYLWDYRRAHERETASFPFHHTRCIYY